MSRVTKSNSEMAQKVGIVVIILAIVGLALFIT
jgi:hypothetical protein